MAVRNGFALFLLIYPVIVDSRGWVLSTYTANTLFAGTDSGVQLIIHGVHGDVSQNLNGVGDIMEGGKVDSWDVDYNIGDPYMITLDKDYAGANEKWKLTKITMKDKETGAVFSFGCDCWVFASDAPLLIRSDRRACYDIAHCKPGHRECGETHKDSLCNGCNDPYFSGGWGGGCLECAQIERCSDRYCTIGSDTKCRQCSDKGISYSPADDGLSCRRCNPVVAPEHGSVQLSDNLYIESVATVTCLPGYKVEGQNTIQCQGDGAWSSALPVCQRIKCPPLQDPIGGSVTNDSVDYQSVATYSCDNGFVLNGPVQVTCQASGHWTELPPTCQLIETSTPSMSWTASESHTNTSPRSTQEHDNSTKTTQAITTPHSSTDEPDYSAKTTQHINTQPQTSEDPESSAKTPHSTNTSPRTTDDSESSANTAHSTHTSPRTTNDPESTASQTLQPSNTPPRMTRRSQTPSTRKIPTRPATPVTKKSTLSPVKTKKPTLVNNISGLFSKATSVRQATLVLPLSILFVVRLIYNRFL